MQATTITTLLISLSLLAGCEEKPETKVEAVQAEQPTAPTVAEPKEPSAEEKAAALAEAQRSEAEAKAQAEVEANPLTECCRSLGQKAFTLRSPEYHGASKACGEAMNEKKELSAILSDIKKALKDQPLPEECAAK